MRFFREDYWTAIHVHPFGNLLGGVLIFFALLPSLIVVPLAQSQTIPIAIAEYVGFVTPLTIAGAGVIDMRCRFAEPQPSLLIRWLSPYEGGSIFFLPIWLVSFGFLCALGVAIIRGSH